MNRFLLCSVLSVFLAVAVSARDSFFDSNGVRIHYVEQGSGEPVVLVHGYSSNVDRYWVQTGVFGNLAKSYRVIALDARGHGKSGKPHDPNAYGAEMGKDVVRLLDHLKIKKAHIIGYSMGGQIVAQLLTTNPARFMTAVIGGSGPRQGTGPDGAWTSHDQEIHEAEASELEHGIPFKLLALRIAPTDQPPPNDEEIRKFSEYRVPINDLTALAAVVRSRGDQAAKTSQLTKVRVPTLAVVGSADPSLVAVKKLKQAWPELKVVVIEGGVHSPSEARGTPQRPEFVNNIREFITTHPTSGQ